MVKEKNYKVMALYMLENFIMDLNKVKVSLFIQIMESIQAVFIKIIFTVKAFTNGKMAKYTMVNTVMIKDMVSELLHFVMGINMKVTGKMVNSMDKVN